MELEEKQAVAKALLERHATIYDVAIPKKLGVLYASASAFSMEGKCAKLDVPGYEEGTFRLVACPPSWEAATATNLDDAVVGEDGEWEAAGSFIPIFNVEQGGYIVAKIDDANLAIGFFNEENFREDGDGYKTGVYMIAKSLDEFRTSLVHVDEDEADYECEVDEEIWDEIGDELEEGEDDDEDEEEEDE
ncbi:MAG TPA: hypothetical protein VH054_04150, partial [Polyangiaceae bacterium]|jgi:hypothetical protein|nr:hypothetical protein [Polyangiaceae bacterium]